MVSWDYNRFCVTGFFGSNLCLVYFEPRSFDQHRDRADRRRNPGTADQQQRRRQLPKRRDRIHYPGQSDGRFLSDAGFHRRSCEFCVFAVHRKWNGNGIRKSRQRSVLLSRPHLSPRRGRGMVRWKPHGALSGSDRWSFRRNRFRPAAACGAARNGL